MGRIGSLWVGWTLWGAMAGLGVGGEEAQVQGPRLSEETFFAEVVNLSLPELQEVRTAVERKDWPAARRAYVAYLKRREKPRWFFDWRAKPKPEERPQNPDTRTADDALRHRFTIGGIPHQFGEEIDWAYNPTTQPASPHPQDNEWTWQFNRHGFWVSLGRAYWDTGQERYAEEFVRQMVDWVRKNPVPLQGADQRPFSRWRTIEAGIRMAHTWPYAFFYCLSSPAFTEEAIVTMVRSMVEHARYLMAHPTGGNWLTMEMNGLYHVGALFPELKEAEVWRTFAAQRLRQELEAQVYPDGAQFELTPGYHNVALANFVGLVRIAQLNGYPLPEGYLENLERMYAYNLWLMTPDRDIPPFNDSWRADVPRILREGHEYFPHRQDFLWVATEGKEGRPPEHTSHAFPYAGFLVQRSDWSREARYLILDAGPFGAGHQHEDKLSFMLMAYGKRFVVDAGSYAYDASQWRRYVLSPYGHNLVFVDGLGQHRSGARETYITKGPVPFFWRTAEGYDYAQASYGSEHEGWGPQRRWLATHTRRVLFVKEGPGRDFWVIADTLEPRDDPANAHRYESVFHLDVPKVWVDEARKAVLTQVPGGPNLGIFPLPTEGLQVRIIEGQEEPFVQGWLPLGHGIRGVRPIPTPTFVLEGPGIQHFLYVFYPVPQGEVPAVEVRRWALAGLRPERGIAAEIHFPDGRTYRLLFPLDPKQEWSIEGQIFSGEFLLLRR